MGLLEKVTHVGMEPQRGRGARCVVTRGRSTVGRVRARAVDTAAVSPRQSEPGGGRRVGARETGDRHAV